MAEGIFQQGLGSGFQLLSSGIRALAGAPPDPHAVEVCAADGIDISRHSGRQLTEEALRRSELVLAMETWQVGRIVEAFPWVSGRVWRLGHFLNIELSDPHQSGRDKFEDFFYLASQAFASWEDAIRSL